MRREVGLRFVLAAVLALAGVACTFSASSTDDATSSASVEDDGAAGDVNGTGGSNNGGNHRGGAPGYGGSAQGGGPVGSSGAAGMASGMGGSMGGDDPPSNRPGESADAGANDPDASVSCSDLDPSKEEVLYLSADDSNSMASPVVARTMLRNGMRVPVGIIRTYEFLNYYNVKYEDAEPDSLRIVPQMAHGANDTDFELQIGVQAPAAGNQRRPTTITLVLDTSGSMYGHPMDMEKATVRAIADHLRSGDIVNAVTWSTTNAVILSGHVVSGPHDPKLLNLANSLTANGGTDLHGGLVAGYKLAEAHYGNDRINRVVLISDGMANVGVTDESLIAEKADDQNREGIYLVGVGTGAGFNDLLMDTVTDAGNGAYVYIDSADEAQKMFGTRFPETMMVAARDVQVKLTLPWYFQMYKFHGEEYSSDPKKVKPQYLAPGDAMVFNQVLRACDASQVVETDTLSFEATWKDPLNFTPHSVSTSMTIQELLDSQSYTLNRGRAIVAYAELLKVPIPSPGMFDDAQQLVEDALVGHESDPDLLELKSLLAMYRQIAL